MNPPRRPPTVLVVDDDPAIRTMLVEVLTLEGYPTETATNGQEALEMLAHSGPRVVLLDLLMPVKSGRDVVNELQAVPEARAQHFIVLVSALNNLEGARDVVVDARLAKPFTVDQLLNTLAPVTAKA